MKKQQGLRGLLILIVLISVAGLAFGQSGATGRTGRVRTWQITVESNVSGATVYVDGVRQAQGTPTTLNIAQGDATIRVEAAGYRAYEETISVAGNRTITVQLQPDSSTVVVQSNVRGAQVSVDGRAQSGGTPLRLELPQGTYRFDVSASGYRSVTDTVFINRDQTLTFNLEPITYRLDIQSNIRGAVVYINGRRVGGAPHREELQPGTYEVRVEADGYTSFQTSLTLNAAATVIAELQPALARVLLSVPPDQSRPGTSTPEELFIFVDGEPVDNVWEFELRPGSRRIRVETGLLMVERVFDIQPGATYRIAPQLTFELNR